MVAALRRLVEAESPSSEIGAVFACADVLAEIGQELLGREPERLLRDGRPHLRWRTGGAPEVALLGHLDTVWPLGTVAARPFTVNQGRATGPGVFDMKAGLVQGLFALAALGVPEGVEVLFTSDEELGSPTARGLIQEAAERARAALVLEPSHEGALKVARKGVSHYRVTFHGVAAHAGLEPEKGINALSELARAVLALEAMSHPGHGTTVTPTVASAGVTGNVVPPLAELRVDVRAFSVREQARVDAAIRALRPAHRGASIEVVGGPDRPPLEEEMAHDLFERAQRVARAHGLEEPRSVVVGGGSDGNLTAAWGVPTLDGLGPVGAGAHAEHEHVVVAEMPRRAALLALLIRDLLG
jgi:glutamate carboxypeptidase